MKIATNLLFFLIILLISCKEGRHHIEVDPAENFIEVNDVKFIKVNGGRFIMGDDHTYSSSPRTEISIDSFYMMQTKVTIGMYKKCVADGKCETPPSTAEFGLECNYSSSTDDHPINCMSGKAAEDFIRWFGHQTRLPTDAEWEYVATNYGKNSNPWGEEPATCKHICIDSVPSDIEISKDCVELGQTKPVCSYPLGYSKGNGEQFCELMGFPLEIVADGWHPFLDCRLSDQNEDVYCPRGESIPKDGSAWLNPRLPEYQAARGSHSDGYFISARSRLPGSATKMSIGAGFRMAFTAP
ncbi:formylglycine-generating enzyme family protein [Myxococcota bacterium]|nr:formylglycine-generating enzyme family protein [Myxococcota bacterium]